MTNEISETQQAQDMSAAEIDARHATKLLERSLAQGERGEWESAILSCRQAVHLNTESFVAHSLLAMLLRRSGHLPEAVLSSEKALKLLPDSESEKLRLSGLRSFTQNGQDATVLFAGEWENFRQEMQCELKLQALMKPLAVEVNHSLLSPLGDELPSPPRVSPAPAPRGDSSAKFVQLAGLALGVALLISLVVWGWRFKNSASTPVPPATSLSAPVGGVPANAASSDQGTTTVKPSVEPAPTAAQNVGDTAAPETTSPSQVPHADPTTQRSIGNRAAPSSTTPARSLPNTETDPQPRMPAREPAALPLATPQHVPQKDPDPPVRRESANAGSGDVGPRFSSPKPPRNSDGTGPRFSNP